MRGIKYGILALADFLLPRVCTVCGRRLRVRETFLCTFCRSDFPYTYNWDISHNSSSDRFNEAILPEILVYEPYSYVVNLFFYDRDNGYRYICHRLKYRADIRVGRYFARELGLKLKASPLYRDVDIVVPVPLHWSRLWSRGYNQAAVIGKEVSAALNARFSPRLLRRKIRTRTQTTLDMQQKRLNVKNAFTIGRCPASLIKKARHILLVDDVFTSGATTAACHSALRRIFPPCVRISVATLATVKGDV